MNPKLNDSEFAGPLIGPVTSLSWTYGYPALHYLGNIFPFRLSEYNDHIVYAGKLYNSFKIVLPEQLHEEGYMFCGSPVAIHTHSIFSQLINK